MATQQEERTSEVKRHGQVMRTRPPYKSQSRVTGDYHAGVRRRGRMREGEFSIYLQGGGGICRGVVVFLPPLFGNWGPPAKETSRASTVIGGGWPLGAYTTLCSK